MQQLFIDNICVIVYCLFYNFYGFLLKMNVDEELRTDYMLKAFKFFQQRL